MNIVRIILGWVAIGILANVMLLIVIKPTPTAGELGYIFGNTALPFILGGMVVEIIIKYYQEKSGE